MNPEETRVAGGAPVRRWFNAGTPYTGAPAQRAAVEAALPQIRWQPLPARLGYCQGVAVQTLIREFRIPHVDAVGEGAVNPPAADPAEEAAAYGLVALDARFRNARVRLYALDTGATLVPLLADEWPRAPENAGAPPAERGA